VTRLPIRVRLTAVFALAMLIVLAGAGVFVYVRLKADLDEGVTESLQRRAAAVAGGARDIGDPEDTFARVERGAPADRYSLVDGDVPGYEERMRVLTDGEVVIGQSLGDRDETLDALVVSFAIGAPLGALVASLFGYALAGAALRPVETIRRRAEAVSLDSDEHLPLPEAHDEIRRLAETLDAMLVRLRESYARERRFVADASHELRTPIAVVRAELETALGTGDREALEAALAECDRLAQLAEDLLVLARASDGALPVRPEPLDACELLEDARRRFQARGRPIEVDAPSGLSVHADPLRARQLLSNLVDNALRHGAGTVTLTATSGAGGVTLTVADEGSGFPAGLEPFERFSRGDAARSGGGAGLGLALVRAISEAHSGEATIDGAAVRVFLPSAGPQQHVAG
jgi:signal transduction histidine kinase